MRAMESGKSDFTGSRSETFRSYIDLRGEPCIAAQNRRASVSTGTASL